MSEAGGGLTVNEDFSATIDLGGAIPVIRASGEVDVATAPQLGAVLGQVPAEAPVLVVDLSEVTFIDSTGIGVLVAGWKQIRDAHPDDGSMRLVVTRPQIVKVLEITGLNDVFGVYSDLADAVA